MVTRDDFVDLMNESYPPYKILGVEFGAGTVLRECDPVHFDMLYHDYCQSLDDGVNDE